MKSTSWLLFPALAAVTSCDRIKEQVARFSQPAESGAEATPTSGTLVRDLAAEEFESFTEQKGKLVVVDFHASWCGPCKKLSPILEKVAAEQQGLVVIGKIDVDQARDLASRQGVRSIPDVRIYRDGKQVEQFVGVPAEGTLREMFGKHTKGLQVSDEATEATEATEGPATPVAEPAIQPMKKDWLPPGIERR